MAGVPAHGLAESVGSGRRPISSRSSRHAIAAPAMQNADSWRFRPQRRLFRRFIDVKDQRARRCALASHAIYQSLNWHHGRLSLTIFHTCGRRCARLAVEIGIDVLAAVIRRPAIRWGIYLVTIGISASRGRLKCRMVCVRQSSPIFTCHRRSTPSPAIDASTSGAGVIVPILASPFMPR